MSDPDFEVSSVSSVSSVHTSDLSMSEDDAQPPPSEPRRKGKTMVNRKQHLAAPDHDSMSAEDAAPPRLKAATKAKRKRRAAPPSDLDDDSDSGDG